MLIEFNTADGLWAIRASDRVDDGVLDAFWPVYDQAFVLPGEKEERSGFEACLRLNAGHESDVLRERWGPFVELVLVAQDAGSGEVIGGANALLAAQPAGSPFAYSIALNYLFLDRRSRGRGASHRLLDALREAAAAAAARVGLPGDRAPIVFVELNDPFRLSAADYALDSSIAGIDQIDRLAVWARHGARILAFDYCQPALSAEQEDDPTLVLGVLGVDAPDLDAGVLAAHLDRFFAISVEKGRPRPVDGAAHRQLQALGGSGEPLVQDVERIELIPLQGAIERLRLLRQYADPAQVTADVDAGHGPPPGDRVDSLLKALDRRGRAHFTLSLMFSATDIEGLIQQSTATTEAQREADRRAALRRSAVSGDDARVAHRPLRAVPWSQSLLQTLKDTLADSSDLQAAIAPMFADIADLDRNLFVTQFLLDTDDEPTPAEWHRPPAQAGDAPVGRRGGRNGNFGGSCDIELPSTQSWVTEGRRHQFEFDAPVRFCGVTCRFFWVAHSDGALSWHASFEVPYGDTLEQYVGLSMLLQALDPGEADTGWLLDAQEGLRIQERRVAASDTDASLLEFLSHRFAKHAGALFAAIPDPQAPPGSVDARLFTADHAGEIGRLAWSMLVLGETSPGAEPAALAWCERASRRRVLVLLRDPLWFDACARSRAVPVKGLEPISGRRLGQAYVYRRQATLAQLDIAAGARPGLSVDGHRRLVSYFLSGFFQNIVDFFEQDGLEIEDGLEPLFPLAGQDSNEGFLLYATQTAMFELVARSRSLDRGGRRWIGTCPYVFLVHLQAMHNEVLVRQYEVHVSRLMRYLEDAGFRPDPPLPPREFTRVLEMAFESLKDFRLRSFSEVHKHYAFGGFRYETERGFFQALEHMRGTEQRRAYWEQVLQHLTDTVDSLREDRRSRFETKIAIFGGVLAVTGLLQLWAALVTLTDKDIALTDRVRDLIQNSNPLSLHTVEYVLGLGLGAALLAWLLTRVLRRFDAGDPTAWRRYEPPSLPRPQSETGQVHARSKRGERPD
jgi:GNAT superfamily N-acetyltransferase